ncbi:MAG TPA: hypothetical protein VNJ03_06180 [Vicinamibacterales bacterium]|nr:hypothetical protein [Vicinamibacterales bacterium]
MLAVRVLTSLRRFAAIALLLVMTPVAYATATCAGWSGSAADRMACCKQEGAAKTSAAADDCCADGEQRKSIEMSVAVLVSRGQLLSHSVPLVAPRPQSFVVDPLSLSAQPDIYLLDSVFLI